MSLIQNKCPCENVCECIGSVYVRTFMKGGVELQLLDWGGGYRLAQSHVLRDLVVCDIIGNLCIHCWNRLLARSSL